MRAKVTMEFAGVRDGQVHPEAFAPGDFVHGDLAAVAVREKWAVPADDAPETAAPAKKPSAAPAKKPPRKAR